MAGASVTGDWPSGGLPLDARRIGSAYERVRPALTTDPLFVENAADFDVDVEELDRRMACPPGHLDADTLWDWLEGADQYRWAGLRVLADAFAAPGSLRLSGRVTVPEGSLRVATGDVVVEGDLVLEDQAMVLVLGTLTVTGALVGSVRDYSLVAAAEVRCRDGVTFGEILALDAVRCTGHPVPRPGRLLVPGASLRRRGSRRLRAFRRVRPRRRRQADHRVGLRRRGTGAGPSRGRRVGPGVRRQAAGCEPFNDSRLRVRAATPATGRGPG